MSQQNQPIIIEEKVKENKPTRSLITDTQENQKLLSRLKKQTQQQEKRVPEPNRSAHIQLNEERFFTVMDLIDEYDKLIKQMNEQYCAGMLLIANVKFIHPYSSLSTKGYKPTPVVTKISTKSSQKSSERQTDQLFNLVQQTKNINFTNSVIESINREIQQNKNQNNIHEEQEEISQFDSQSAHSSMSTANQLYSFEQEELIMEEQQIVDQCRKFTESDNFSLQDFLIERFSIETQKSLVSETSIKFCLLLKKLLNLAQRKIEILKKFDEIQNQVKLK